MSEAAKQGYFLVVLSDDAENAPVLFSCDNIEALRALIDEHVLGTKRPVYAFGFKGERIKISAPSSICHITVGDEQQVIGGNNLRFDESGRFTPLVSL